MSKVLVIGGAGFLGSHVADCLSESGYDVTIFDKQPSPYLRSDQKSVTGDVLDKDLLVEAISDMEYVYNFAAIADIKKAQDNPIETVKTNVLGSVNILEACRLNYVKRFIYGSTVYVYSKHGSFYRSSKQSTELFIENYNEMYNLDYTVLRYGSLYGARSNSFNFINTIINQAILEKKIVRKGNGNEIREYINVLDAARASVEILNDEYRNENVIITGTQTMRMRDLLSMIREMFNNEIEIEYLDEKMDGHYEITPYSFKPRVARKFMLNYYHDLGEGILGCIYENYGILAKEEKKRMKVDLPNSIDH